MAGARQGVPRDMKPIPLINAEHADRVARLIETAGVPANRYLERSQISLRVRDDPTGFIAGRSVWAFVGDVDHREALGDFWLEVAQTSDWRRAGWVQPHGSFRHPAGCDPDHVRKLRSADPHEPTRPERGRPDHLVLAATRPRRARLGWQRASRAIHVFVHAGGGSRRGGVGLATPSPQNRITTIGLGCRNETTARHSHPVRTAHVGDRHPDPAAVPPGLHHVPLGTRPGRRRARERLPGQPAPGTTPFAGGRSAEPGDGGGTSLYDPAHPASTARRGGHDVA